MAMYQEIHATLRNIGIEVGLKPPAGKFWTGEMFRADYREPEAAYNWQLEKKKMTLVNKRPDPAHLKSQHEATASTQDRFRQAHEATQRGASRDEIRLLMEA